ncbi:MAG: putative toxin-antitoxin system toxin component, PIN family [Nitrospirota bacterium]|nr:putative toxin-antitoxin system toxin component, PIN family [Nitrospirota bacterium]
MRIVLDTNIFVSALVFPGGRADEALRRVLERRDDLIFSKAIISELLEVLSRKFERDKEALSRIAVFLSEMGEMVHPHRKRAVLEDEPDNRILECALSGKAELIVTGDRAMLNLVKYDGIKIVSLKASLDLP